MTQKELLSRIAGRLVGIEIKELTNAESQIFALLEDAGILSREKDKDFPCVLRGEKYSIKKRGQPGEKRQ